MLSNWPADTEPSTRFPLYTRGNVGEVFPNVVSVLTGTLIGDRVNRASERLFDEIGLLRPHDRDGTPFGTGIFWGYLYANASLFRLMGVRMPGMKPEDADQQVSGTGEDMPPYVARPGDRDLIASLHLLRSTIGLLRRPDVAGLDRARRDAAQWHDELGDPASRSIDELMAVVVAYPARLEQSMYRLLRSSVGAGAPRALLDRIADRADSPGLVNRAVGGIGDVDSALLATRLWQLGRLAADNGALHDRFDEFDAGHHSVTAGDARAWLRGTALDEPFEAFLADLGHRCYDEYELAQPSWAIDPRPVLATISRLRSAGDDRDPSSTGMRARLDAEVARDELIRAAPLGLRRQVGRFIESCRVGAIARERAKDILVLENHVVRLCLHELFRRAGAGDDHVRAGCVHIDELHTFVHDSPGLQPTLDDRLTTHAYLSARIPPFWFDGTIPDPSTWPLRAAVGATLAGRRTGIGVSGGRATGPAKVVSDPTDPRGLEPGDVLVCAMTDPAWTPLFLLAGAVVCDVGAMLSHAAIVARELGIPAVLSVAGATTIRDGTMLTVDGDRGTVDVG